jgi:protein-L-isoaspartate(D-aspartate) O-methyltransferase
VKPDLAGQRDDMVGTQLAERGIRSAAVLEAMRSVPREDFVEPGFEEFAYRDAALPIAQGQTISQPYIVAFMIEAAEVGSGDRVLEVGAGSGYAAAVLGRIAAHVLAIERHEALAAAARERIAALGYRNVDVVAGDGSRGAPGGGGFDAILVAAAAPEVPAALKAQLADGGRLVMPVGEPQHQRLVRVRRTGPDCFEQEDLAGVSFVPLIGEQGWPADPGQAPSLSALLKAALEPLPEFDDPAFGGVLDRFADRRVVMLGEASHGTSEFYRSRAAISRHLIRHHGFNLVAVEADWPDAAAVDRYVRHRDGAPPPYPPFERFPTWMWRNREFAEFTGWLRRHNASLAPEDRVAFHGLDIYNLRASIAAVLAYLERVDPAAARIARERYGCLTPWQQDPAIYGRAALEPAFERCEQAVVQQCRDLLVHQLDYAQSGRDSFIDAAQNARLVAAAERYYRVMYHGGADGWNLRDSHMFDTLSQLLDFRGPAAKAIVWAHNSHIGDARFTDMGMARQQHNIGQLARQAWGSRVALVGQGTHAGTVAAAHDWDGEMQVMRVRPSRGDSYEYLCHDTGQPRFLLDLGAGRHAVLREQLMLPRLERYIGVIYRPDTERWSHYAESILPRQYDAFLWFDQTRAVQPLDAHQPHAGVPDTYPFGV